MDKHVIEMRKSREELSAEFQSLKKKNAESLEEISGLFLEKDKQINILKVQK